MNRLRPGRVDDDGAAAVELALLLPLLLLILGGVIDFGLAFNAQISLTHAAREGVRVEAIGTGDPVAAATAAYQAPGATNFSATVTAACPNAADAARLRTQATYDFILLPLATRNLSSEGVMRCNG